MGNVHLVTGYRGEAHVTSRDQAEINVAMFGRGDAVLRGYYGSTDNGVLAASMIDNNTVSVSQGKLYMQGRYVMIDSAVELKMETGTQGKYRKDLIVAKYTLNTTDGVEDVNLIVLKGTPAGTETGAAVPEATYGSIAEGKTHEMALFVVHFDGLNITSVEPVYTIMGRPLSDFPISAGNERIVKLADPVSDTDAANRRYVNTTVTNAVKDAVEPFSGVEDMKIQTGTATISYLADEDSYVKVTFPEPFDGIPVVMVSQVFNDLPLCTVQERITSTSFRAAVQAVGSTGSRTFSWVAIGKKSKSSVEES